MILLYTFKYYFKLFIIDLNFTKAGSYFYLNILCVVIYVTPVITKNIINQIIYKIKNKQYSKNMLTSIIYVQGGVYTIELILAQKY